MEELASNYTSVLWRQHPTSFDSFPSFLLQTLRTTDLELYKKKFEHHHSESYLQFRSLNHSRIDHNSQLRTTRPYQITTKPLTNNATLRALLRCRSQQICRAPWLPRASGWRAQERSAHRWSDHWLLESRLPLKKHRRRKDSRTRRYSSRG